VDKEDRKALLRLARRVRLRQSARPTLGRDFAVLDELLSRKQPGLSARLCEQVLRRGLSGAR
jgi:hypothetical protein